MKDLEDKLEDLNLASSDIDANWCAVTSLEHLGRSVRKHQDWFDQNNTEIQALLDEKRRLHGVFINDQGSQPKNDAYNSTRRKVQTK